MNKIIFLVGNIGSGKSTIAKKLAKEGFVIVSRDALRHMFGAGEFLFTNKTERVICKSRNKIIRELMKLNLDIVIDETNMTKNIRNSVLCEVTKNYKTIAYIMPKISKKESIRRRMLDSNGNTSKSKYEKVWTMFNSMYEDPTFEEFDEIIYKIGE